MEKIFPMRPDPGGHSRGDRLLPGIIAMTFRVGLDDRIVSLMLRAGRFTDERRSIVDDRRRRRSA